MQIVTFSTEWYPLAPPPSAWPHPEHPFPNRLAAFRRMPAARMVTASIACSSGRLPPGPVAVATTSTVPLPETKNHRYAPLKLASYPRVERDPHAVFLRVTANASSTKASYSSCKMP